MLTRQLVNYIQDIHFENLDVHTLELAKLCVEDFLGVAIAGSEKKESKIWNAYYSSKASVPQATVLGADFPKASYEQAAALNAAYGHVLDMDDVHNASITHLAAITIPTALALGQHLHKSGAEVLEAIVSGYEAGARIGEAINPSSYKYWHTTAVVGPFSSGATAGKLLGLSNDEMVNCFGSAGTQAAGLWEFLASGSMSKVLHTANANLCGIRSAELAKLGFTGAPTILEGNRAFIQALAPEYHLDALTKGYGQGYRIASNSFKSYACCRHTHSANYCIEQIFESRNLNVHDIESIVDNTYSTALQTTNNPYPENSYAAKFSLQYCIAAAILFHDLSDRAFTAENIRRPEIQALMKKIQLRLDPKLDAEFLEDPNKWSHRIVITLRDGNVIEEQVDYPIGDFKNPFTQEKADKKFDLLTMDLPGNQSGRLLEGLHRLEELDDINQLFDSLN